MAAIESSGYPLQTRVASFFRARLPLEPGWPYHVQEEWSYIDDDGTNTQLRALDLFVESGLYPLANSNKTRIRPTLNFLIECKQSTLPYVFFGSPAANWLPSFPMLAGIRRNTITIITDDDPSTWREPVWSCLGLSSHPFVTAAPVTCMAFSKCVRKGSGLDLSGADPYQHIVLPLLKAAKHFRRASKPPSSARYFDMHAVIPLAVVEAPMVLAPNSRASGLVLAPWVRVLRHEIGEGGRLPFDETVLAIDIVHSSFLGDYVSEHVVPFLHAFAGRALEHETVLSEGKAFVPGMGRDPWHAIDERLRPSDARADVRRGAEIARRLLRFVLGDRFD